MFLASAARVGAARAATACGGIAVWVGAIGAGDPAGQEAVHTAGIKIGEQDGDRLTDDPAPVGGGAVAQQREPRAFQVK